MDNHVRLRVNGEVVDLNPFVEKALAGVLTGFIAALDRVPKPIRSIHAEVEVEMDKKKEVRK